MLCFWKKSYYTQLALVGTLAIMETVSALNSVDRLLLSCAYSYQAANLFVFLGYRFFLKTILQFSLAIDAVILSYIQVNVV